MSLIICPDCGNECSVQAVSCPNCGHPFETPVLVEEPTVIASKPEVLIAPAAPRPEVFIAPVAPKKDFPYWVFVPLAILLVAVVFGFIYMAQTDETANKNVNVNIRQRETANTPRTTVNSQTATAPPSRTVESDSVTVVPPSNPPQTVTVPDAPATTATVPSTTTTAPPVTTKGDLAVTATVVNSKGTKQAVRQEKIYLLDEDLETILSKARIENETGDYSATLGAALADPNKKDLLAKCLAAIKPHIIYSTTTDGSGKASFKNIEPDNYYLFGVTKSGNSAAVWNTTITIAAGGNSIALNGTLNPVASDRTSSSGY